MLRHFLVVPVVAKYSLEQFSIECPKYSDGLLQLPSGWLGFGFTALMIS